MLLVVKESWGHQGLMRTREDFDSKAEREGVLNREMGMEIISPKYRTNLMGPIATWSVGCGCVCCRVRPPFSCVREPFVALEI